MTQEGITKYWSPEQEEASQLFINNAKSSAEQHLLMTIRDVLKYDGRTKAAKRARAQMRWRIAIMDDKELQDLANLEKKYYGDEASTFDELKERRETIRKQGIRKQEVIRR